MYVYKYGVCEDLLIVYTGYQAQVVKYDWCPLPSSTISSGLRMLTSEVNAPKISLDAKVTKVILYPAMYLIFLVL